MDVPFPCSTFLGARAARARERPRAGAPPEAGLLPAGNRAQMQVQAIQERLNTRPRTALGCLTTPYASGGAAAREWPMLHFGQEVGKWQREFHIAEPTVGPWRKSRQGGNSLGIHR